MSSVNLNHLTIRHAAGNIYLVDSDKASMHYHRPIIVNEMGEEIFELLVSGKSVEEAAEMLSGTYDVEKSEIVNDIMSFLNGVSHGYVEWR